VVIIQKKIIKTPFLCHHSDQHVGMNYKSLITENEEKKVRNSFLPKLNLICIHNNESNKYQFKNKIFEK